MPRKKNRNTGKRDKARIELMVGAYFRSLWSDISSLWPVTMSKGPGVRPDAKFAALLKSIEVDREFRKRLISNPRAVLKEQGIEISKGKVKIKIVENTPETIYLVLPRVIKAKDYKKITDKINIEAAKLSSLRAGLAISLSLGQDDWDPTMNKANTSFADDEFSGVDGNDRTILGDDTDPSMNPKNKKNDFFGY